MRLRHEGQALTNFEGRCQPSTVSNCAEKDLITDRLGIAFPGPLYRQRRNLCSHHHTKHASARTRTHTYTQTSKRAHTRADVNTVASGSYGVITAHVPHHIPSRGSEGGPLVHLFDTAHAHEHALSHKKRDSHINKWKLNV